MSLQQSKAQKARVVDISDSSSQASEDNSLPARIDPKANRVRLHYAAPNPDRPNSGTMGRYGMFSQCSPSLPAPPIPSKTPAKGKRKTMDKRGADSNKKLKKKDPRAEREVSPLFEPEHGWQEEADIDIPSPPSTSSSNVRLPIRKKGKGTAILSSSHSRRAHRPIVLERDPPSSDPDSDTSSNIAIATIHNLTPKATKDLIAASSLPGDVSRVDEYIDTLQKIADHAIESSKREQAIATLTKEETAVSLALNDLPAEEQQHYINITQACAKGISTDMATPIMTTDMSTIQAAIAARNEEAETARAAVPEMMAKRKEELEAQMQQVRYKKEGLVQDQEEKASFQRGELQEMKAELEEQGSIAMALELGKRLAG
jgi:hypothetical protein